MEGHPHTRIAALVLACGCADPTAGGWLAGSVGIARKGRRVALTGDRRGPLGRGRLCRLPGGIGVWGEGGGSWPPAPLGTLTAALRALAPTYVVDATTGGLLERTSSLPLYEPEIHDTDQNTHKQGHMPTFRIPDSAKNLVQTPLGGVYAYDKAAVDAFTPAVMGLGDISSPTQPTEVICAIVDLEGFTTFSSQVDPHLVIPDFLSRFLDWFFSVLRDESKTTTKEGYEDKYFLFTEPPFFTKFMGDGILLLWKVEGLDPIVIHNIVGILHKACSEYIVTFHKEVSKDISSCPDIMRCGIARGRVFSIGDGQDFVGPCINIAARLQKINGMTFCVSKRGLDFAKHMAPGVFENFILKRTVIRGIGNEELVYVLKGDLEAGLASDIKLFSDP